MKSTKNKSLKELNTFMVEAFANEYIEINNEKELTELFEMGVFKNKFLVLGGGSNTLFVENFDGIVVHPNILGKEVIEEDEKNVTITIGAGENWTGFVEWSVKSNFLGLQNLANIPGDCGATPVQNVGAYGVEVKDFIITVDYFDTVTGEFKKLSGKDCKFGYRNSIFKNELKDSTVIISVTFKLQKWPKDKEIPEKYLEYGGIVNQLEQKYDKPYTIQKVFQAVTEIRDEKLPKIEEYGSCGSTFANPLIKNDQYENLLTKYPELPSYPTDEEDFVKIPAAYILENLGWKNKRVGKCGTWIKHPLIVTNYDNASGKEIFNLIQEIQKDFHKNTGIDLNTEINIIF